jgi:chromosome segregation ATPase
VDDPQRLARQAIRSQAAAREYAERHLARAEQAIQDLQAKLHAVRREKAIAIEAARAAQEAQTQAERARRAAEAALINEKSVSENAQREAREARATVQDLRTKLAQAKETVETLRTQLERARQAGIAAEARPGTPMPTAAMENVGVPGDQPVKRKRGRPPRNRDESAATRPPSKPRKFYADRAPVQWWTDGWTPRA